jgi:hypothetical protein
VGDEAGLKVMLAAGDKDRVREGFWVREDKGVLLQRGVRVTAKGEGDPVGEGDKLCCFVKDSIKHRSRHSRMGIF